MPDLSPPRARYSMRTLLIVVALTCLVVGIYMIGSRLRYAEQQLRKLRNETGMLAVEDRSKVHVISVATGEPNTWQWRLFLPQGHRYSWNLATDDIPRDEPPQQPGVRSVSNEPYWDRDNEVLVTARLRQGEDGNWRLSVDSRIGDAKNQMHGTTMEIPQEKLQWMEEVSSTDGRVAGKSGVTMLDPKGPIILLQRRPCQQQPDGSWQPSADPMPGFMIWLEEE